MGKDLEIGVPRNLDLQLEDPNKNKDKIFDLNSKKDGEKLGKERVELSSEVANGERSKEAVDLLGSITNNYKSQMKCVANEVPNDVSQKITNIKDKGICKTKELPSLDLSLKRQRDVGTTCQERNVLRHSDLSAFSRYNNFKSPLVWNAIEISKN